LFSSEKEAKMNRKVLSAMCILGLCASATAPTPPTLQPAPAKVSPVAQSEANLRELIFRLIPIGMFGNVGEFKPDVVLGRLPSLFPSELKLPAGADCWVESFRTRTRRALQSTCLNY
jgi:hypothetical protein